MNDVKNSAKPLNSLRSDGAVSDISFPLPAQGVVGALARHGKLQINQLAVVSTGETSADDDYA